MSTHEQTTGNLNTLGNKTSVDTYFDEYYDKAVAKRQTSKEERLEIMKNAKNFRKSLLSYEHESNGLHFLSDEQQNINEQEAFTKKAEALAEKFANEVCPACGKEVKNEGDAGYDDFSSEECYKAFTEETDENGLKVNPTEVIEKAKAMSGYIATHRKEWEEEKELRKQKELKKTEAVNDESTRQAEEWKEAA